MNYLLSLLPVLLYLIVLKALDSFSLAKWKLLLAGMGLGALSCIVLFFLSFEHIGPLAEEVLKGGIAIAIILKGKVRFLPEALIYGAAVGAGFSLLENIIYLYYQPDMMAGTALVRGFGCAILHIGCTGLTATIFLILEGKQLLKKVGMPVFVCVPLSMLLPIGIHFGYNLSQQHDLANPLALMTVVVVLFLALFALLFVYGEKRIYRWMDHSISVDVQTLSAIRAGIFSSTKAGEYLLAAREQFAPECFFDMLCYVQLFLDLKIEKQSRMLLAQAGFADDTGGEAGQVRKAKLEELSALRKNIGRTGMRVLSPLVSETL